MKRYQITSRALTTGAPIVHTWSDSPAEALDMANKVAATGARDVEIRDSQADKFIDLKSFAAEHRLG
ncbi:MAG: hypothetical protein AB7O98_01000 [Hyphomonadaceae bacterium]